MSGNFGQVKSTSLLRRLHAIYWPHSSATADPLDTARRRCLNAFALIGAICSLAISFTYYTKNFVNYPAQGATVLIVTSLLLLSPIFVARLQKIEPAARVIIGLAFIVIALMSSLVDGMVSFKVMLLMPLAMVATLTLGGRQGAVLGLAAVVLFIGLHLGREGIGGNIATPLSVAETSYLMAVSLSFCLIFIVTGAAIFRSQMQKTLSQLDEASQRANASSEAKSQFLALMSHEIRTPLHGILGMNELLGRSDLDMDQSQYVNTVNESASNLLTILNDVLDFSETENGNLRISASRFHLRRMIEGIACQFSPEASRRQLELVVRYAPDVCDEWHGDANRIRQIISNLVSNALKYTERGYIQIRVVQKSASGHPRISVEDSGIGFDQKYSELIFEQFTQLNQDSAKGNKGAGLGLAVCRSLARAMGGEVHASSEPGVGSRFELALPIASYPDDQKPTLVPVPRSTAVLVDGMDVSRVAMREVLNASYEVVHEATSLGAMHDLSLPEIVNRRPPAAVFINADAHPTEVLHDGLVSISSTCAHAKASIALLTNRDIREVRAGLPETLMHAGIQVLRKPLTLSALSLLREQAPLVDTNPAVPVEPETPSMTLRPRVLIAEDNEVNRMFLKHFLKRKALDVVFAENGAGAIEAVRNENFDLVIMDIEMPIVDGIEATRAIRRYERLNQRTPTHIVAVTASALAGDRERFLGAGMDDYLAKPYRIEDFDSMLSRWLPKTPDFAGRKTP